MFQKKSRPNPPLIEREGGQIGFRVWKLHYDEVADAYRLAPTVYGNPGDWGVGVNISATCRKDDQAGLKEARIGGHEAPQKSCSCGYYFNYEPVKPPAQGQLLGAAICWGHMVGHARNEGFRCQHCRVIAFVEPEQSAVALPKYPEKPADLIGKAQVLVYNKYSDQELLEIAMNLYKLNPLGRTDDAWHEPTMADIKRISEKFKEKSVYLEQLLVEYEKKLKAWEAEKDELVSAGVQKIKDSFAVPFVPNVEALKRVCAEMGGRIGPPSKNA